MSSRLPRTTARERPENLAILLREAFAALNDLAIARLAERGHGAVRPAHGAVFQYLDDAGTTVSTLAERARMTKQSMAELVRHLEAHGYVERLPDPEDRRAKLVHATDRGREVFAIAQAFVVETEERLLEVLGAARMRRLRDDLETVRRAAARVDPGPDAVDGCTVERFPGLPLHNRAATTSIGRGTPEAPISKEALPCSTSCAHGRSTT